MIIVQMEVRRYKAPRAGMHMFFEMPEGPRDLKAAWLRNCNVEIFNEIVEHWEQPFINLLGTHTVRDERRIGSVRIRRISVHDASVPPSYEVRFELVCGIVWSDAFECELKDLTNKVRKCHENSRDELKAAAAIFEPGPFPYSKGSHAMDSLMYAGIEIGTAKVKRIT